MYASRTYRLSLSFYFRWSKRYISRFFLLGLYFDFECASSTSDDTIPRKYDFDTIAEKCVPKDRICPIYITIEHIVILPQLLVVLPYVKKRDRSKNPRKGKYQTTGFWTILFLHCCFCPTLTKLCYSQKLWPSLRCCRFIFFWFFLTSPNTVPWCLKLWTAIDS